MGNSINFVSSKDNDEKRAMHSKNDNSEFMIYDNSDEFSYRRTFQQLLSTCQIRLKTSMRGSDFIFDCADLLCYKCHKINLDCGASDILTLLIAFNALYAKNEKIYPIYISKQKSKHEKQLLLFMIPNREG